MVCAFCKHRTDAGDQTCQAFPVEIPTEIVTGVVYHDSLLPGQVGNFLFEPKNPDFFAEFFPDVPVGVTIISS